MNRVINIQTIAGFSTTFIGNGLGRFAYIALVPLLIQENWFSSQQASYLGVSTLLGYLLGAYVLNYLSKFFYNGNLIRYSMLICSLSSILCSFQEINIVLYAMLRILSGFTGAILMILGPSFILPLFHKSVRGRVGGIIFTGIGLGIIYSSMIVPLMFNLGARVIWISIGGIGLFLTFIFWKVWDSVKKDNIITHHKKSSLSNHSKYIAILVCIAYLLNAVGYLPHTLFWTDYLSNELYYSLIDTSMLWTIFGVGAFFGPIFTGISADMIGVKLSLIMSFVIKAIAVALPLISSNYIILFISSLLVGIFTPGTASLVSTYLLECLGNAHHQRYWGIATFCFALSQVVGGYLMTLIAGMLSSYSILFYISSVSLIISSILIFLTKREIFNENLS